MSQLAIRLSGATENRMSQGSRKTREMEEHCIMAWEMKRVWVTVVVVVQLMRLLLFALPSVSEILFFFLKKMEMDASGLLVKRQQCSFINLEF